MNFSIYNQLAAFLGSLGYRDSRANMGGPFHIIPNPNHHSTAFQHNSNHHSHLFMTISSSSSNTQSSLSVTPRLLTTTRRSRYYLNTTQNVKSSAAANNVSGVGTAAMSGANHVGASTLTSSSFESGGTGRLSLDASSLAKTAGTAATTAADVDESVGRRRLVKLARPTIFDLPYPLLAQLFVYAQNPAFLRTCRLMRDLGQDPYVRCQYLEYKYLRNAANIGDDIITGGQYHHQQHHYQQSLLASGTSSAAAVGMGHANGGRKRTVSQSKQYQTRGHHQKMPMFCNSTYYHGSRTLAANTQRGSFFAQMLRAVPPAENACLWAVLKHRHMLDGSTDVDVYNELKAKELQLLRQQQLAADFWVREPSTARQIVFTWIEECCEDFDWSPTTRYLAYMTLDRYISVSKNSVDYQTLQQTAGACLSLVYKAEETHVIPLQLMAQVSQAEAKDLCNLELRIMKALDWNINMVPTSHMFLSYFVCQLDDLKSVLFTPDEQIEKGGIYKKSMEFLDWGILNPWAAAGVLPSLMGAWALWLGLKSLDRFQEQIFTKCTEYSLADVEELNRFLLVDSDAKSKTRAESV